MDSKAFWLDSLTYWLDAEEEWAADYNERRYGPRDPWLFDPATCLRMAQQARGMVEACERALAHQVRWDHCNLN